MTLLEVSHELKAFTMPEFQFNVTLRAQYKRFEARFATHEFHTVRIFFYVEVVYVLGC